MKYNIPDRVFKDIIRAAEKSGVEKLILFGSRARGTNHERSDIDIAASGGMDAHAEKEKSICPYLC